MHKNIFVDEGLFRCKDCGENWGLSPPGQPQEQVCPYCENVAVCSNCLNDIPEGAFKAERFAGVTRIICGECFDAWHRENPNSGVFE